MEVQTVQLKLQDITSITGSLLNVVSTSFGPIPAQALMVSSTGQVSVTSDGISILSALHISHPVAKVIVDSAQSLSRAYGDGIKTFIIYIHELLLAIERNISNLDFSCNAVSKSLSEFASIDLLSICNEVQAFVCIQNGKGNLCRKVFDTPVFHIAQTCLNELPTKVNAHVANIVDNFASATKNGNEFTMIFKFFDTFVTTISNQSYMDSYVSDGLVLQGTFSGHTSSTSCTKLIYLQCSLEGIEINEESTDTIKLTSANADSLFTYRTQVVSTFLHYIKHSGVSLILSTHKVPDYILQICYQININILACLEMDDLEVISCITGKSPVTSVYDSVSENNIVPLSSWECVHFGGKNFVKFVFDLSCFRYIPKSVFLCAPTESLCQKLKMLVRKSVTVVEHCLYRTATSSFQESDIEKPVAFSELNYVDTPPVQSLQYTDSTIDTSHAAENHMNLNINLVSSNLPKPLLKNIIPAGGYFENVLSHFIQCHMKKSITYRKQFCCRMIVKILEAVPKLLHNKISSPSIKSHTFLQAQSESMQAINNAVISGDNAQGIFTFLPSEAVDVLKIKFEILFAALHLVIKILRIDAVIGVKRSKNYDVEDDDGE